MARYDVSLLSDVKSPAIQISKQIPSMTMLSLLVCPSLKNRAPPKGGAQKEGKRVKEQKEKGLLLHPPLRHEPT